MTPEVPSPPAVGSSAAGTPKESSIGWQLLQVAGIAALLTVGMCEVDRDAKALAEKHARAALVQAVEAAGGGSPPAVADPRLEQAFGTYAKACAACAEDKQCQETIRSIRAGKRIPAGGGPCKEGIFERWSRGETARSSRAQ